MNISKNSVILKVGALLGVTMLAWISLTSACPGGCDAATPGQICFSYYGPCQFPAGTQLCMSMGSCCSDKFGNRVMCYGVPQCCNIGGTTPQSVTGTVYYKGHNIGTQTLTWAEAGATSCAQAEAYFNTFYPNPPFTVSGLTCPPTTYSAPGSDCFDKVGACPVSPTDQRDLYPEGQRYIGYIKCPNGSTFAVTPISLAEATGASWCSSTNLFVTFPEGCPACE